jgi:uncharacterized membrane protein
VNVAHAVTRGYLAGMLAVLVSVGVVVGIGARRGGRAMNIRRWRLWLGVACIAAAAVVGVVGYLKVSDEPLVNHQIPYLASAGMALVVLSVVGGSLVVAEQVRADERQIAELEAAVAELASAVAPAIEALPRRRGI